MPTEKQIEKIIHIHKTYVEKVAPLIEDLESVQGCDLNPLYNEVRAIMGHLSRCYQQGKRISVANEIRKALGHLDRLTLDTYKVYAIYFTEMESVYECRYKWADLSMIDNHGFYKNYFEFSFQGKQCLIEARKQENMDRKAALLAYENMYVHYHRMMDYLDQHKLSMDIQLLKFVAKKIFALLALILSPLLMALFVYAIQILTSCM